jgi:hypothetical protein
VRPTLKQLVVLCRVPASSIPHAKRNGKNGNGHKPTPTLADRIEAASPAERLEAARKVGIETIWDSMISPIVSEERAAAK